MQKAKATSVEFVSKVIDDSGNIKRFVAKDDKSGGKQPVVAINVENGELDLGSIKVNGIESASNDSEDVQKMISFIKDAAKAEL